MATNKGIFPFTSRWIKKSALYPDIRWADPDQTMFKVMDEWFLDDPNLLEITPNIIQADTWQEVVWDISAVTDADKNAIKNIIITIINADANNTFYIDNMYGEVIVTELVIANASHVHTAQNVSLTQKHTLSINNCSHAHTAESPTLTQKHTLTINNSEHTHTAQNITLIQKHTLVIADCSHPHIVENVELVISIPFELSLSEYFTNGDPTTAQLDSPSGKTTNDFQAGKMQESSNPAGAIDLDADKYMEIEFCIQATDDVEDEEIYEFRITDNGVALDTYTVIPEWTVGVGLAISNCSHIHTVESLILLQKHLLVIQNSTHPHTAENISLIQHFTLEIQSSVHSHIAENIVLTQEYLLTINDAIHSHIAEDLSLTQKHILIIANTVHLHTAENVELQVDLQIADATHSHTSQNVVLMQKHILVIQSSSHGHSVENIVIIQHFTLEIADASHAHTVESIDIIHKHILIIQYTVHSHTAEGLILFQKHILIISNILNRHISDNVRLRGWFLRTRPQVSWSKKDKEETVWKKEQRPQVSWNKG